MKNYKVSLAGKLYTIMLSEPGAESSLGGYSWLFLVYGSDYDVSSDPDPDDALATVQATFSLYNPKEVYWFPSWMIESLALSKSFADRCSSFGSELVEWCAEFLQTSCKSEYIYLRTASESLGNLLSEKGLWEPQTDREGVYKKSRIQNPKRILLAKEIEGLVSLTEDAFYHTTDCYLVEDSVSVSSNHTYTVSFTAKDTEDNPVLSSSINFQCNASMTDNQVCFTVTYYPISDEAYLIYSTASNYVAFVKKYLNWIAGLYDSDGVRVVIETTDTALQETSV